MVELENRRGKKLGMEVGVARERILIALFICIYGKESVEIPPTTSAELDVAVNGTPISIKTKLNKGHAGVKLVWTVDWDKVDNFIETYKPKSHLLYVNIVWNDYGGFYLIPQKIQQEILNRLGRDGFFKRPPRGTNPRGVELSKEALPLMQSHTGTKMLKIKWERDESLETEMFPYERWIELWQKS